MVMRQIRTWTPLSAYNSLPAGLDSRLQVYKPLSSPFRSNRPSPMTICTSVCAVPRTFHLDFRRAIHTTSQCLSTEAGSSDIKADPISDEDDFRDILYRQPNMRALFLANKLKFYQSAISAVYLPFLSYLYIMDKVSAFTLLGQSGLMLSLLGGLYYISATFLQHVAGVIYINEARDQLKIAHMTFWGKREEDILDVIEVMPIAAAAHSRERFKKIKLYTGGDFYFVDKKMGHFPNKEKFTEIFGRL